MEAMWIKGNADPFEWVGKVMSITGCTAVRGMFKVSNVVVTDIKTFANKITSVKVKDEDGYDYTFTGITDYEVVKEVSKIEFQERAKRKHQPKIEELRFKLDKQYRNTEYGEPLLLKKSEIAQLRQIKKRRLSSMADDIDDKRRWVYYKNRIVKEERE
jgi:ribosomal protein L3